MTHTQGRARGDDGLFHYVKWNYSAHAKDGGFWNGLSWCSYDLDPYTPCNTFIRCYKQKHLGTEPIDCLRCAARDPRDPRPWG
jgi:hypothetical protein